jgi:hypothetical protein
MTCLVARAGIEAATFRFSGGVLACTTVFLLVRWGQNHPIGRAGGGRVASSVQFGIEDAGGQRGSVDGGEHVMEVLELIEVDA